jgi:hypothetical protein
MAGKTTAGGWGWLHQQLKRQVARVVATGAAVCARCGLPIEPGEE